MTDTLSQRTCEPCGGGVPPLDADRLSALLAQLETWVVERGHHLSRTYEFPDFRQALAFVNRVGELAEREGHHPDLYLTWGKVRVEIWTHKVDGLTESDFILAAKIDDQCRI
ncbi:MAG TPA: 4a-hydroxytetrahydrobiopterin dehydratase [Phycisphaerae bacterium]|nr:4a-hydroxytetrahydrobiopterin dehydratase [Phycisphaerae bacterium]HNU44551.1 4a-hydroxytetrahydrobiopterin dehydratase [Phycisphaerae bacterium]